jgi:hypothetical protein
LQLQSPQQVQKLQAAVLGGYDSDAESCKANELPEQPMSAAVDGRRCDACTACCFTHAVAAIEKPNSEWCPHCEIGTGCRIYFTRPEQCREFSCLWLQGWGDVQDRPDRLKVVMGGIDVDVAGRRVRLVQLIETAAGAIDQAPVTQLIGLFRAKRYGICIARLLPSGRHADAVYEIPNGVLAEGEVELFKAALRELDPFA